VSTNPNKHTDTNTGVNYAAKLRNKMSFGRKEQFRTMKTTDKRIETLSSGQIYCKGFIRANF